MIIKNGRVFQEDGTFAEKDLYIEGKRFVSTKEEVIDQEAVSYTHLTLPTILRV